MRFLSLRLKPKAAAAPRAGRGPGTGVDDDVEKVTTIKVLVLRLPAVSGVVARGLRFATAKGERHNSGGCINKQYRSYIVGHGLSESRVKRQDSNCAGQPPKSGSRKMYEYMSGWLRSPTTTGAALSDVGGATELLIIA